MSGPPAALEIRPMTAADLPRVLEIAASLPAAPHWPLSAYRNALDPQIAPARIALVAAGPAALHGFALASLLAGQAELETVAVAPSSQRRGIARELLAALLAALRQAGIRQVFLEVRASNHPARALYSCFGFEQTGSRPHYYADPVEDAILMSLALTP